MTRETEELDAAGTRAVSGVYLAPRLVRYGPLKSRTASGTLTGGEHTGVGNDHKKT